jgi:hypothetical protein
MEDMRQRLNWLEKSILSMISSDAEKNKNQTKSSDLHIGSFNSVYKNSKQAGDQLKSVDTTSTLWYATLMM